MRLGVDEVADWRLFFHHLAPAHRVDRLLRRVDHHVAVAGLDKARVAAGIVDFGEAVRSDPAHDPFPSSTCLGPVSLIANASTRTRAGAAVGSIAHFVSTARTKRMPPCA